MTIPDASDAPVRIGLLGLGTVGLGVARILVESAVDLRRRAGRPLQIAGIVVRDASRARDACEALGLDPGLVGTDADALIEDPGIDVVLELVGGDEPAHRWTRAAIAAGKHVVTANKALVALRGEALFEAAHARGVAYRFEAAVAGGIPVIKALEEGLAANRAQWLAGIINGTGNFILSEMAQRGRSFGDALADAQALGYAEADPTFDVEGIDAAHKLAILASLAFDAPLAFDAVHVEGISKLDAADVGYAAELGYRIKHLGIARRRDDADEPGWHALELRVHPALVPASRLLASVDGVNNAVVVHGDAVGSTLYYGPGAGAGPTGSAVVADVIDIVRGGAVAGDVERTRDPEAPAPLPPERFRCPFYLRIEAVDRPGVLAHVAGIFGEAGISIEAILQKEPAVGVGGVDGADAEPTVPIILLTRTVREGLLREAVARVEALDTVTVGVTVIRVETLD